MARPARALPGVWGRAPRGGAKRLAVTLLALFAFVLQTFVVQTHIHGSAKIGAAPFAERIAGQGQQPDKFPPADDPANCQICQELLHAGSFVTPMAAALLVSSVVTDIAVVVVEIEAITQTYAHGWTSRGPPLS